MNIVKMNETNLLVAESSLSNIPRFKYLRVQSFPPCPKLPASTVVFGSQVVLALHILIFPNEAFFIQVFLSLIYCVDAFVTHIGMKMGC